MNKVLLFVLALSAALSCSQKPVEEEFALRPARSGAALLKVSAKGSNLSEKIAFCLESLGVRAEDIDWFREFALE